MGRSDRPRVVKPKPQILLTDKIHGFGGFKVAKKWPSKIFARTARFF
jgi:hypothetical protein